MTRGAQMIVKARKLTYKRLRELLKINGFVHSAPALSAITGRSPCYMARCLSAQRSFQPDEMDKILDYFKIDKRDAMEYFPPFGIERHFIFTEVE